MKDNNNMLHGGKLKPEFYQSWANYYAKFIKAYQKEGIPIWGISIQNEPMATQTLGVVYLLRGGRERLLERLSWPNDEKGRAG